MTESIKVNKLDLTPNIDLLRAEAGAEKECFVRYSFQTFGISSLWLSGLFGLMGDYLLLGLSGVFISGICTTVSRLGLYKYATANRILGYELYIGRNNQLKRLDEEYDVAILPWEIAMKAWRVVTPTIFESIYDTTKKQTFHWFLFPSPEVLYHDHAKRILQSRKKAEDRISLNKEEEKDIDVGIWFLPHSLVAIGSRYFAGSYLNSMILIHSIFSAAGILFAASVPLLLAMFPEYYLTIVSKSLEVTIDQLRIFAALTTLVVGVFAIAIYRRFRFVRRRQSILESELLSIYGCSVLWHMVTVIHLRAEHEIEKARCENKREPLDGYIRAVSHLAMEAIPYLPRIHTWLSPKFCRPTGDLA